MLFINRFLTITRFLTASEVIAMLDSESEDEFDEYIEENCDNNESDAEMEWDGNECTTIDENEGNASSSESSRSHTLDSSDQCTSRGSSSRSFQSSGTTSFSPGCTFDMSGRVQWILCSYSLLVPY